MGDEGGTTGGEEGEGGKSPATGGRGEKVLRKEKKRTRREN